MSPNTKARVKYARGTQLGLRLVTLLGALGSLFCSIVIKNAAVTVIWIIRAGVSHYQHCFRGTTANSQSPLLPYCTRFMASIISPVLQSLGHLPPKPAMDSSPQSLTQDSFRFMFLQPS